METFEVVEAPKQERRKLSARCPLSDIEAEFGVGAYLYFDFLRFLICMDALIFLVLLASWVPHLAKHHTLADGLDMLFVSGYDASNRMIWRVSTGLAFVFALGLGWLYPLRARQVLRTHDVTAGATGDQLWALDSMNILPELMGFIERNMRLTHWARSWRMLLSAALFVVFTILCAALIALPVIYQVRVVELVNFDLDKRIWYTPVTFWDFLVAAILKFLDFLGKRVAGSLTHLERHKRRATHSKHKTAKLFIFKVYFLSLSLCLSYHLLSSFTHTHTERNHSYNKAYIVSSHISL